MKRFKGDGSFSGGVDGGGVGVDNSLSVSVNATTEVASSERATHRFSMNILQRNSLLDVSLSLNASGYIDILKIYISRFIECATVRWLI